MKSARLTLADAPFAGRTGRGVTVAVVDSGINAANPHVGHVAGGVSVGAGGVEGDEYNDALGHGTAVGAAIREKAPAADLIAVKVFDRALATSADVLARSIVWAAARGARLINLSLGTTNVARQTVLRAAVDEAASRGALVVSASEVNGARWLPGCLGGVAGVQVDWGCQRDELEVHIDGAGTIAFRASGYPRPIPGVPPARNLAGASFAVANVTGFLARLLEADVRTQDVARVLVAACRLDSL
ncbi:MAG: S8 family serine peptidase [Gemmatimonadaceae bacterium]